MPTNHQVVAALPIVSAADQTLLRNMLVQRTAYVVDDAAQAADLIAVDPSTGVVILVIICLGRTYLYDSADSTTAHDGISCLVTSDSKRYKLASNAEVLCYSVLDRTNTPPGSPAIGDAYLAAAAPTGAWSGNANKIEVYTARGWEVITPAIGRVIYVEDEDAYYRRKADGSVSIGFGTNALTAASVPVSAMDGGGGIFRHLVENQTTNTPPAVTNGVAYIIGSSPTGAWSGHAGKIARGEAGAWVIYTPAEGWKAYDKSTDTDYLYSGSAWVTASGDVIPTDRYYVASTTWAKPARLVFVDIVCIGGGGGGVANGTTAGNGGTSSFGSHISSPGGSGGTSSAPGAGGTSTGGDYNPAPLTSPFIATGTADGSILPGASSAISIGSNGRGGGITGQTGNGVGAGGPGAASRKRILAAALGANETVTVGAAGAAGAGVGSTAGLVGIVHVREWTRA